MSSNFYDKVAKKFGGYRTEAKYITECPNGNPEKVFKERLLEFSGKDKTVLDVGCADGRFSLSVASYFKKINAVDTSKEMLVFAQNLQKEKGIENVSFEEQDAFHTTYKNASFDMVYSRRGPSNFTEAYRLLKLSGRFIEITIGEKDCQEIKNIFGRGQGFGQWNISRLEKDKQELRNAGFEIVFAQDFSYDEYYVSYGDLDLFLQGVPIFEDFDSEKDKNFLKKYVAKFKMEKGIRLPRHRVVIVAKKP